MACSCKLKLANVACHRPHHLPKHEKFIGNKFIGTELDFIDFLREAVGGLFESDDKQFDNVTPRLSPSIPQIDNVTLKEIWPAGVPDHVKEVFKDYSRRADAADASVINLDTFYFEQSKLFAIHRKHLAYNLSRIKRKKKELLYKIANTPIEEQEQVIEFSKVGCDKDPTSTNKLRSKLQTRSCN